MATSQPIGVFVLSAVSFAFLLFPRKNIPNVPYRNYDLHIKITMVLSEDGVVKKTTSVVSLLFRIFPEDYASFTGPEFDPVVEGFAPMIELSDGQEVFLSFANAHRSFAQQKEYQEKYNCVSTDIGCLPFVAYGITIDTMSGQFSSIEAKLLQLDGKKGAHAVPLLALPAIELIDRNAKSVRVRCAAFDLASCVNRNVVLKDVQAELTEEPVSGRLTDFPRWLDQKAQNDLVGDS